MTHYFFDSIIGNPPYNEDFNTGDNDSYARPVYHHFMDAAISVGKQVELITPTRFLFDAGSTPKDWNHRLLNDPHFQVIEYYAHSADVFPETDIRGGVCISHYDNTKTDPHGPIKIFIPYPLLNSIRQKVEKLSSESLSTIISTRHTYCLSDQALLDHPEISTIVSKGHAYDIGSNAFTQLKNIIFFETKPDDTHEYAPLLGLYNRQRRYFWIRRDYLRSPDSFLQWKVFLPQSNGSGNLGETLSTPVIGTPVIGTPVIGTTDTFLTIGKFHTQEEAENCLKYIKTKFARVLLSILKITESTTRDKWRYVPLQDFTSNSSIHWKESVSQIDQQFYTQYGLTEEEQQFIETHVKSMD